MGVQWTWKQIVGGACQHAAADWTSKRGHSILKAMRDIACRTPLCKKTDARLTASTCPKTHVYGSERLSDFQKYRGMVQTTFTLD